MPKRAATTGSPQAEAHRLRLAAALRSEREAQGATQKEVAERGGIGVLTVLNAEQGRPLRAFSLRGLDAGLGWPRGTAARILDGAEPPPVGSGQPRDLEEREPAAPAARDVTAVLERLVRIEAKLDSLLTLVASRGSA